MNSLGDVRRLSAAQKILVHLAIYGGEDCYEFSGRVTQKGIYRTLGITQSMASYALKSLKEKQLVEEKLGRVKGEKRKIKVYMLTPAGRSEADRIMNLLRKNGLKVREGNNVSDMALDVCIEKARMFSGKPVTIVELLAHMDDQGVVRLDNFLACPDTVGDRGSATKGEGAAMAMSDWGDDSIFSLTLYAVGEGIKLTKDVIRSEMEAMKRIADKAKSVGRKKIQKIKKITKVRG